MPKPVDIHARIAAGKSVMPLTWRELTAGAASLAYVVVVGLVVLGAVIYFLASLL